MASAKYSPQPVADSDSGESDYDSERCVENLQNRMELLRLVLHHCGDCDDHLGGLSLVETTRLWFGQLQLERGDSTQHGEPN